MQTFDVAVIGAGPGGYVCAIKAAQLGLQTCIIESDTALGGTCLNVGCIPSKALLESSHHFHEVKQTYKSHGIESSNVQLNLTQMMLRKQQIVQKLTAGIGYLMKKNAIKVHTGRGKIVAPNAVQITTDTGESTQIKAKHIVIATGSVPIEIPIAPFDGEQIVSSTEALAFTAVPERLAVIGGGVIGLEMASVWSRLGSSVTVIEAQERLVSDMDAELGTEIHKILQKQGMKFSLATPLCNVEVRTNDVQVAFGKTQTQVDKVLVAVGRKPNTDGLGLEELGVKCGKRGEVVIDSVFATNIASIYAIGDVVRGPMLAHKAEEEGVAVAELIAGKAGHVNYRAVPSVVYTFPELAAVGMSEEEARKQGLEVKTSKFFFRANGRALTSGHSEGFVKTVTDANTDEVLGAHIIGAQASELIAEWVLGIEYSASAEDIARTCHAHPTLAEASKESALGISGQALHS